MTVTVGWVDGGTVRGEFTEAVTQLAAYEAVKGRLVSIVRVYSGPLLEEGRNRLVEKMLTSPAEWLLMIDTDMTFDYDAAERLTATAEDLNVKVVGGLAFGVNDTIGAFPTTYQRVDGMPTAILTPPDGPADVDATGAAFLLTHRSVFEDYRRDEYHPWFHRRFTPSNGDHRGGWLGEDISWCFWLRDKDVRIVVDPAVQVGHVKAVTLDSSNYRRAQ